MFEITTSRPNIHSLDDRDKSRDSVTLFYMSSSHSVRITRDILIIRAISRLNSLY